MIRFIALCGNPRSGKNEVQNIIHERYGFAPLDDSRPLRQAVMTLYGLSEWHVTTQDGKESTIDVGGEMVAVRTLLSDTGRFIERRDPLHFPRLAVASALQDAPEGGFVFASLRLDQGRFFRDRPDSRIIEITRSGTTPLTDSDSYDRTMVDHTIDNDVDPADFVASRKRLAARVAGILDPLLDLQAA